LEELQDMREAAFNKLDELMKEDAKLLYDIRKKA
jgi:hypothetical protein